MPRPNRFSPDFSERLRQSRIARGLEQAPEPCVQRIRFPDTTQLEAYMHSMGVAHASIDWGALSRRQAERPSPRPMLEAIERFRAAYGGSINQVAEAKPMELTIEYGQPITPSTTFLDHLHACAADAIRSIHLLRDNLQAMGATSVEPATSLPNLDTPTLGGFAGVRVRHTEACQMRDQFEPGLQWDNYGGYKTLYVLSFLLAYTPVRNALLELADAYPANRARFAELREITDLREYFAGKLFTIYSSGSDAHSGCRSRTLPVALYSVSVADLADSNGINFNLDTPIWTLREQWRLLKGEYLQLPQRVLDVLPAAVIESQFPHMAMKPGNAGMIAFTQSPVAGAADRQQVMKAGRYIRQHCPDLSDEQVKQLAAEVTGAFHADVKISHDEADFARVYEKGPSSCMAYGRNGKDFHRLIVNGEFYHPTRVYAHPDNDIRIAWLEVDGRIAARALINIAKKQYPSLYGSDSVGRAATRLGHWLHENGYEQSDDALDDQILLKVHPDGYRSAIICPYIDCGNRGVAIYGDHLIVGGSYEANHETGCLQDYDTDEADWYCDCCGDGFSDDDDHELDNYGDRICEECAGSSYTYAYNPGRGESAHYLDSSYSFYTDMTPRYRGRMLVFTGDMGDYVFLSGSYYSDAAADLDYTAYLADEDEYILEADAPSRGYFQDPDGDWFAIADYAVLDGELVERSNVPDDAELCPLITDSDYPDLPVYQTVETDDSTEEAAA